MYVIRTPPKRQEVMQSSMAGVQQQQPNTTDQKYDNIGRVKTLVWSVKDSLAKLMKIAAEDIAHNGTVDSGVRPSDEAPPKLDRCLEDFFSICNQIELNLRTIQECSYQFRDSQQYLPLPVSTMRPEPVAGSGDQCLSYSQYLSTIKNQVAFSKAVQDILAEGARKISQME